jgi:drug/metabolite transporter (DMT)-like permease
VVVHVLETGVGDSALAAGRSILAPFQDEYLRSKLKLHQCSDLRKLAMIASRHSRLSVSTADWLLLFLLSVLWGGAFFFGKVAIVEIPPLTLALGRVAIAAGVLAVFVRIGGSSSSQSWSSYIMLGLLQNVIPFGLVFWGQIYIPSSLSSILIATTPLFTVLIAHIATVDDKLTLARLTGLVTGFSGVAIIIGPDLLHEFGTDLPAEVATLLGALSYAIAGVYGRRFRSEPPLVVSTGQLIASTILLAPAAALIDRPWNLPIPSSAALCSLLGLAVLSTALGYLIYFRILSRAGATNVMLVTFLMPVSTILLGILILDEHVTSRHLAGLATIVVGLIAIDGRAAKYLGLARRRYS